VRLQALPAAELSQVARQALGSPVAELLEWQIQRLSGGSAEYIGGGQGVYRVVGSARAPDGIRSWSAVLKITGGTPSASTADVTAGEYWKREALLYQADVLAQLPPGIAAPRCYGISVYPGDEYWLWLEDLQESIPAWTLETYTQVAHHLGLFNGAYLAGYPLPTFPWLGHGRVREWLTMIEPMVAQRHEYLELPIAKQWLRDETVDRMLRLWNQRQRLLDSFERLPQCFCHHDAFRRSLFVQQGRTNELVTVAIDWATAGLGRVGEEAGMSMANNLFWLEVPVQQARALDSATFTAYVTGLRQAGWDGDPQLARLGYTVNAAMTIGVALPFFALDVLRPDSARLAEAIFGHRLDVLLKEWAQVQPFLLDLGEEALQLLHNSAYANG
jgi:hypothetical protein